MSDLGELCDWRSHGILELDSGPDLEQVAVCSCKLILISEECDGFINVVRTSSVGLT